MIGDVRCHAAIANASEFINGFEMPIAETSTDMICCRAPSLVIDLPEYERICADVRLETPYAQPSNFRCRG